MLVTFGYAQQKNSVEHDFSVAKLTAPPTTNWPTNGGNLYNQRYSPLMAINRGNVAQLKGVWRARLRGSGTGPQYSGGAQPIVQNGVAYVSTGANDVFALSIETGETLWQYEAKLDPNITSVCCGWINRGVAISEDKAAPAPPAVGAPDPASLSRGEQLYKQACVVCHGKDGKGEHGAGAPLASARDLAATSRTVTEGRNNMPPFGRTLTAEQIRDLAGYVADVIAPRAAK